jgi:flagellar hook assembly protein FlgD
VDLVDRVMETGSYSVDWDGRDGSGARVADGVYFYRLKSGGESLTKEMVHLR